MPHRHATHPLLRRCKCRKEKHVSQTDRDPRKRKCFQTFSHRYGRKIYVLDEHFYNYTLLIQFPPLKVIFTEKCASMRNADKFPQKIVDLKLAEKFSRHNDDSDTLCASREIVSLGHFPYILRAPRFRLVSPFLKVYCPGRIPSFELLGNVK